MTARHPGVGDLRHRIQVARRTRLPDAGAGYTEALVLLATLWARYEHEKDTGWLDDATGEREGAVTHAFTIRRDPLQALYKSGTYIVHEGRRFRLMRVREDDQHKRFVCLLCSAEEDNADGAGAPWALVDGQGQPVGGGGGAP